MTRKILPIAPRLRRGLKASLVLGLLLTAGLTGCLTDSDYDLSNYDGPPFNYVGPRPAVVQDYVYECKRTKLGGEYCEPKPVGQPYAYGYRYLR